MLHREKNAVLGCAMLAAIGAVVGSMLVPDGTLLIAVGIALYAGAAFFRFPRHMKIPTRAHKTGKMLQYHLGGTGKDDVDRALRRLRKHGQAEATADGQGVVFPVASICGCRPHHLLSRLKRPELGFLRCHSEIEISSIFVRGTISVIIQGTATPDSVLCIPEFGEEIPIGPDGTYRVEIRITKTQLREKKIDAIVHKDGIEDRITIPLGSGAEGAGHVQ